jgi:hypothetical protein
MRARYSIWKIRATGSRGRREMARLWGSMGECWVALKRFVASASRRLASSSVLSVVLSAKYSVSEYPTQFVLNRTRTQSMLTRLHEFSGALYLKNRTPTGVMVGCLSRHWSVIGNLPLGLAFGAYLARLIVAVCPAKWACRGCGSRFRSRVFISRVNERYLC